MRTHREPQRCMRFAPADLATAEPSDARVDLVPKVGAMPKKSKTDVLIDEIKDEIDRLHEIKQPTLRGKVARELIEYIELHHNPPTSNDRG